MKNKMPLSFDLFLLVKSLGLISLQVISLPSGDNYEMPVSNKNGSVCLPAPLHLATFSIAVPLVDIDTTQVFLR